MNSAIQVRQCTVCPCDYQVDPPRDHDPDVECTKHPAHDMSPIGGKRIGWFCKIHDAAPGVHTPDQHRHHPDVYVDYVKRRAAWLARGD
jgi:hypothetical protein